MKALSVLALATALLACATLTVRAQETPTPDAGTGSACMKLADVIGILDHDKDKHVELNLPDLLGDSAKDVGAIIVAEVNGEATIGFEIQGCVFGPVDLGTIVPQQAL